MASTSVQVEIANWIRREWLSQEYEQQFIKEPVRLSSGGSYTFDAVSNDRLIAVAITTSGAKTASGHNAIGKKQKVRADMYFLLLAEVERRIVVFTELDMLEVFENERTKGRVPKSIEFERALIPEGLESRLQAARRIASDEVSPRIDRE
jgi:hypothetical protein